MKFHCLYRGGYSLCIKYNTHACRAPLKLDRLLWWMSCWLLAISTDRIGGSLDCWLIDCLIDWSIHCLIEWMIEGDKWLIGWTSAPFLLQTCYINLDLTERLRHWKIAEMECTRIEDIIVISIKSKNRTSTIEPQFMSQTKHIRIKHMIIINEIWIDVS